MGDMEDLQTTAGTLINSSHFAEAGGHKYPRNNFSKTTAYIFKSTIKKKRAGPQMETSTL
jgi:hypothetical protein